MLKIYLAEEVPIGLWRIATVTSVEIASLDIVVVIAKAVGLPVGQRTGSVALICLRVVVNRIVRRAFTFSRG